jgi:ribosomal protein S2
MKEENLKKKLFKNFLPYKIHVGSLEKNLNFATKPFLQEVVENCCVFDLTHTYVSLNRVKQYIFRLHEHEKKILFVGPPTSFKKEFSDLCENYKHYFIDTWFDGLFTNLNPVYQKKRKTLLHITERPSLIFIFDLAQYEEVKKEALRLEIPIMAFFNSDDNIENIDYPIPGNIKSLNGAVFVLNFFCEIFRDAEEAKTERKRELERRKKVLEEAKERRKLLRLKESKRRNWSSKRNVVGKKDAAFSNPLALKKSGENEKQNLRQGKKLLASVSFPRKIRDGQFQQVKKKKLKKD